MNDWDVVEHEVATNWCRGTRTNRKGQHCVVGAIEKAVGGSHLTSPLARLMIDQLRAVIKENYDDCHPFLCALPVFYVEIFNDSHSQAEALAMVQKARAKALESA